MDLLDQITKLSHEFGTSAYVRGGGGNTSVKENSTLWVKPSGTTLADLTSSDFLAMDRSTLGRLYDVTPPDDASAREALVKEMMEQAVLPQTPGRASVEAPLHNSLAARYVVHTHPALVNGMTCGKHGKSACEEYFPQSLWVDYVDPGYTLCMEVRKAIKQYEKEFGREPSLIFLKNHGVFVSADDPDEIRELYARVLTTLERHYENHRVGRELGIGPEPDVADVAAAKEKVRRAFGGPDVCVAASGPFVLPEGPVSPDHIVYAKSYYMTVEPTVEEVQAFTAKHGYLPHIVAFGPVVLGIGPTQKKAELAMELAADAAWVKQLAEAFGGIDYMSDDARAFIENWEVESYRSQQVK